MNQADFDKVVHETINNIQSLLKVKGGEYAGSSDRLANFKRGSSLTGCTPMQVLFIYMSKHYDAVSTFIKKDAAGVEQVLSEPIEGRVDDLINYCLLLKALIRETQGDTKIAEQTMESHRNAGIGGGRHGLEPSPAEFARRPLR